MNPAISEALKNWVPWQLKQEEGETRCRWLYLGDKAFTEPFFDETIQACRIQYPVNRQQPVLSTPDLLTDWSQELNKIAPTALIFHVSRCGSTLLAQLLSQLAGSVVLSEVPFIDAMLRRAYLSGWEAKLEKEAIAACQFYFQKRAPQDQRLFIKTDSWHLHFYPFWQRHFPGIPRVLLYRHPADVIRSQQKRRGLQSVPGLVEPAVFGLPDEVRAQTDLDRYMGQVLETYYRQMLLLAREDPGVLLCNYHEGMTAVAERLLIATGEKPGSELLENWSRRSEFHGKYPTEKFAEEPVTGNQPDWMQELTGLYEQLEEIRLRPQPTS